MLTRKQKDLLIMIHERMKDGDIAPSFDEMREALGLKSKSGIHRLITGLVERGYLERLPHRARALEVKKLPDGYSGEAPLASNNNVASTLPIQPIPLYGKIAAGTAIDAIAHEGQNIDVPVNMIASGEHYALSVEGDSMINAGIHDGDIVIIKRCETAHNGDIIVALIDDQEVTLKRFQKNGGMVSLIPENDAYETRTLEGNRVKIQGKLSSLLRTYH